MDLTAARTDLEQVVRESDAAIAALAYHEDDELDIDEADVSSELTEADREEALAALARIEAGTYGICVDCGNPIPEERLAFRPEAARCLEDQKRHEERDA
jgi:RNA polymerase-binding transcription factor DksA